MVPKNTFYRAQNFYRPTYIKPENLEVDKIMSFVVQDLAADKSNGKSRHDQLLPFVTRASLAQFVSKTLLHELVTLTWEDEGSLHYVFTSALPESGNYDVLTGLVMARLQHNYRTKGTEPSWDEW